ncbi:polyamine aminopropyltransferase [Bacillus cereus]|nr:polyamine aminopropyltransferase [Bacillus cereus]
MPKHRRKKHATIIYEMIPQNRVYQKVIQPKTMTNSNNESIRDEVTNTKLETHSNNKNIQDKFNNTKLEVHSNRKNIQNKFNNEKLEVHANTLDVWDEIALTEIQAGEYTSLFKEKSKYQDINLVQVNDMRLYLDKQLQFSSVDEQIYHEALVHPIMSKIEDPQYVLILGGGDALALREVLKYENVLHVDLVDLDEEMIRIAREIPEVVALNQGALFDDRVNVHICDAMQFLQSHPLLYDVIIIDFPDPANELLSQLYTKEFFTLVSFFLTEGGAFVCQSNSPIDTPLVYWSIGKTIRSAGLTVKSYHTIVPSFGNDWGFHIATNQSAILKRIEQLSVTVPQRTLPPTLSPLFQFRKELLEQQDFAVLNTQDNLTLHDCYRKDMQF